MKIESYQVEIELTEDILGSVAKNEEVYTKYIARKMLEMEENGDKKLAQEVATLPEEVERAGWTGFHNDKNGIFLYDYVIRGFLKSAAQALKPQIAVKNYKSHIDQAVFVFPRKIRFQIEGKSVKAPSGALERPLRAMTMQGPRVTLAKSDQISAGARLSFELRVLPGHVTKEQIEEWLDYGQLSGLGQWRNAGHGRFKVVSFKEAK